MAGALVKDPDRLEPAHMRHEDIHDHQIEPAAVKRAKAAFAAIGHDHLEPVTLQKDLNGHADHRIVIDDKNTRHDVPKRSRQGQQSRRIKAQFLQFRNKDRGPSALWRVYGPHTTC